MSNYRDPRMVKVSNAPEPQNVDTASPEALGDFLQMIRAIDAREQVRAAERLQEVTLEDGTKVLRLNMPEPYIRPK